MLLNFSEKLINYMRDTNGRQFAVKLKINGSDFPCEIRSMKIRKGSCGSTLQPQSYYSSSADVSLNSLRSVKHGDKLEIYFAAPKSGDEEFYKVMTVYIRKPVRKLCEINFTAEGAISAKLGLEYVGEVGVDIQAMLNAISIVTGVNIILEEDMDTSLVPNQNAKFDNYLMREVLAEIAGCYFGYATEDIDGNIVIKTYKTNAENSVIIADDRLSVMPDIYEEVEVKGIQVKTTNEDGQTDFVYPVGVEAVNCVISNRLMTEELFNAYVQNFVGLRYTPFSMVVGLGDISIEPFDTLIIDGKETIITEIIHTYDGGLKTELTAATLSEGEEYSRTETEMESEIAFDRYPTATGNGGGGGNTGGDIDIDPTEHYVVDDLYNVDKNSGSLNVAVKDNAICTIECLRGSGYLSYDFDVSERTVARDWYINKLDKKYMPAYPVSAYAFGSNPDNKYKIFFRFDILPELNENGYVKTVLVSSYLDPKVYSSTLFGKDYYTYNDPANNSLNRVFFTFRVQYLLKSFVDSLNEGSESE